MIRSFSLSLYLFVLFALFLETQCKIRINEVAAHTDEPYYDFVELYNEDSTSVDISGWGLTDSKKNFFRYTFPRGTVLEPGKLKSVNVVKLGGFRLNKWKDKIILTESNGETHDDAKLLSSLNHFTYSFWRNSDGEGSYVLNFPSEEMQNRYPIVGPFVISEIGLIGTQQYIKITCIRGTSSIRGSSQFITRRSPPGFEIRLKEQKDVYDDNDLYTTPAYKIPTSTVLDTGESIWIVSGSPNSFSRENNLPTNRVFGPWKGTLQVSEKGENLGLYAYEGHPEPLHFFPVDVVQWAPKAPWPVPPAGTSNFVIERVSLTSYSNDPRNWRVKGTKTACASASTCPGIDKCTLAYCSAGFCEYTALSCLHPNFGTCYPDVICQNPAKFGYSSCNIETKIFGHGKEDYEMFGSYGNREEMYWKVGCVNIDGSSAIPTTGNKPSTGNANPPPPPPPSGDKTISVHPAEFAEITLSSSAVHLTSSDLEFGNDQGEEQWVYIRIKLNIPASAVISSARMQFEVDEQFSGALTLSIGAEKTANSESLTKLAGNFNSRGKSREGRFRAVDWEITDTWAVGATIRTPDLTTLIQTIIAEPGWSSGNFVSFIIRGSPAGQTTRRTVKSAVDTITLTVKYTQSTNQATEENTENLGSSGNSGTSEGISPYLVLFAVSCGVIVVLLIVVVVLGKRASSRKTKKIDSTP